MNRVFPAEADVVIVGSGPTGAAYARILSELGPGTRVVMFEVGPQLTEIPGAHVKGIADEERRAQAQRRSQGPLSETDRRGGGMLERPGTFPLGEGPGENGLPAASMSSNVGGMAAHWTGACPRPGGSERIGFRPDLDDLLAEGERLLAVSADAFPDAPFAADVRRRLAAELDTDRDPDRRVAPMPLAVVRHEDGRVTWSGTDVVFGEPTRQNADFTLVPEALVKRVLLSEGTVRGVTVVDRRTGAEQEVRARYVVVAGDALRTPQVLWASGIRPRALGRYLNDQPQTLHAVRLRDVEGVSAQIGQGAGVSWVPFTDQHPFHGQVMQMDASPVALVGNDGPAPGTIVGLGWFCAKDVREDDRIEFSGHRLDSYGMPAMRIHYRLTEADHASIAAAAEAVRRAGALLGEPLDDRGPFTLPPGASLHYQGTVRMGETDDGTSVCSPASQVWNVNRLYLGGNGVIPTATACNPTLTSVALAVAGAQDIARRIKEENR